MTVPFTKILIDQCYETRSGELRRVTRITPDGDVVFTACSADGDARPGGNEQMPGALFAQQAVRPVGRTSGE